MDGACVVISHSLDGLARVLRPIGVLFRNSELALPKAAAVLVLANFPVGAVAADATSRVPAYVGSAACADCHTDETEAWRGSHHALAWTEPTPENILADFDGTTFSQNGMHVDFRIEDGLYYATVTEKDGVTTDHQIHSVAGIVPLQQYLIETEPGRVQSFDVVWDVNEERWYHLYPEQDLPPDDAFHWTGPYKNWNARCAECHATGFEKNYSPIERTYASTQAEIGVGCEACHGPGEAHSVWANPDLTYNASAWQGVGETGLTMDFAAGIEATIQQCASCHARREPHEGGNPLPGTPFHDAYRLSTLRDGLYHPDGQILDEVYVYGSFLQSKMYAEGVSCMDCHTPHSAELKTDGNSICTQCHSEAGNPGFSSLRLADYDNPSHHFHPEGSAGAQCKSCHMIERDYMGIDGRRDHSFRVPRPDLSVTLRTPNACSDCHADQTAAWAAEAVATWYPNGRHTEPHFAQTLAPARQNPEAQVEDLLEIAAHANLPGIVRASALDLLAQVGTAEIADQTETFLSDPDPTVRAAAVPPQRSSDASTAISRLAALLSDPRRTVRMAAAREFLGLQVPSLPQDANQSLGQAMREWQDAVMAKADFPESQLVIGGMGLTTRQFGAALRAFEAAVRMDPQLIEAWTMMVRIHSAFGNREAALATVNAAIAANPSEISLKLLRTDL